MPKASDYKKMHEADNHFVIRHPDGSHFKVAKKGLDDKTLSRISQMPQHFDDGGTVQPDPAQAAGVDPSLLAPQPNMTPLPQQSPPSPSDLGASYNFITDPIAQTAGLIKQGAIAAAPAVMPWADNSKSLIDPSKTLASNTPAYAQGLEGTGQPPPLTHAPQPQAISQGADPMAAYYKPFQEERAGAEMAAKAKNAEGSQIATAMQQAAEAQQKLQGATAGHEKALAEDREKLETAYREKDINPNQVYENMKTGNRILAGISLVLGGLAGGLNKTGGNVAMDVINNAISRDIDAQKANMDKRKNLLAMNYEKTRDMRQAQMLTESQLLSAAKIQTEMAGAKAMGPMADAAKLQTLGAIDGRQMQLQRELAKMKAIQSLTTGSPQQVSPEILDEGMRERLVRLPNGQQRLAYDKEGARGIREQLGTVQPLMNKLDELDALGKAALVPGSAAANKADAIRATLIPLVNENAGLKRLSAEDIDNIKKMISDPTSFRQMAGGSERSNVLRGLINDKLQSSFENQLEGYKAPPPVPSLTEHRAPLAKR
jgi:hypothetical protein